MAEYVISPDELAPLGVVAADPIGNKVAASLAGGVLCIELSPEGGVSLQIALAGERVEITLTPGMAQWFCDSINRQSLK